MLRRLPPVDDPRLIAHLGDDAAVLRLSPELAVVQTVDCITPIVNDPYLFGQIVAANALSDIYAMGGRPVMALNIVGYPIRSLPAGHLEEMLRGGADKAREAGVAVAGGHTLEDPAPKYGMAVTGIANPAHLVTKRGARPGDALFLTKPIGTGVLATALEQKLAGAAVESVISPVMTALNRGAAEAMLAVGVHACTDVTGFGLLGHLHDLARASGLSARVYAQNVPVLPGARALASRAVSRGTLNNLRHAGEWVAWESDPDHDEQVLLCDAQTSGGLLIAVSVDRKDALIRALEGGGCLACSEVGRLEDGPPGRVLVSGKLAR